MFYPLSVSIQLYIKTFYCACIKNKGIRVFKEIVFKTL